MLIIWTILFQSCVDNSDSRNKTISFPDTDPYLLGCEGFDSLDEISNCTRKKIEDFIAEHLQYPKEARDSNIEGSAIIRFIVKADGSLAFEKDSYYISQNTLGGGCEEEAVRLIRLLPQWISGKRNSKAIDMYYNIRVDFYLSGKKKHKNNFTKPVRPPYPVPPPFIPPPPPPIGDEVYKSVSYMPHFPGCEHIKNKDERKKCSDEKIEKFLEDNIKDTSSEGCAILGSPVIRFVVEKDGSLSFKEDEKDVIIMSPCYRHSQVALKAIKSMPKWIPGNHRGEPTRVEFIIPVKVDIFMN